MTFYVHLIGQSNAGRNYNFGNRPTSMPYPEAVPADCYLYRSDTGWIQPTNQNGAGIAHYLRLLSQVRGEEIRLVQTAFGGTSVQTWIDTHRADAIAALASASVTGTDVGLVIWVQGEADANQGTTKAEYKTRFVTMMTAYFEGLGYPSGDFSGVPRVVVVQLPITVANAGTPNRAVIAEAQQELAAENAWITLAGLPEVVGVDAGVHYVPAYYVMQAQKVIEAFHGAEISISGIPELLPINQKNVADYSGQTGPIFVAGGAVEDHITGSQGDDIIYVGGVSGGADCYVVGGPGNNDIYTGDCSGYVCACDPASLTPGVGTISTVTQNKRDPGNGVTHVLGDADRCYYLSGDDSSFLILVDFSLSAGDRFLLHGQLSDYTISAAREDTPYLGITPDPRGIHIRWAATGELICSVGGDQVADTDDVFDFVTPAVEMQFTSIGGVQE